MPPACVGPVVGGLHRRLAAVPERHTSRRLARAADDARRFIIPARCRVSHSRFPARAREGFAGLRQAAVLHFRFFRRSHGKFVFGGAQLWQILEAGEWRSPAFMKYLDVHRLETDLVMQAHIDDESESEEDVAAS